ncbi:MAG: aminotransferase class V-fold PLP-dependent enzyme [Pseudomonadota bacterium]
MTHSGGRDHLAMPGPSIIPDRVLQAMHRAAPNIYAGELVEMMEPIARDLCDVARTKGNVAIYIGNGHAAWEAVLANLIAPGELVLVPATGRFGLAWGDMAQERGIEVETLDFGRQSAVGLARFEEALRADPGHRIKAVLATHVDTSTGVLNDIPGMRAALDAVGHPALLVSDNIASLACDRFEMDGWGVDAMVAGCQKGLMVPPGMSFVFVGPRAIAKRRAMPRVSRYWDFLPRIEPEIFYQYFCGTAPTHHLYGLRAALDMLAEEGLDAVWRRHERLARAVWAACDTWAAAGVMRVNIADHDQRSRCITALALPAPLGADLRGWLEREAGVTLGIGLGMETPADPKATGAFRIGHMGHLNLHGLMGVLGAVEAGLQALSIPHGQGALPAAAKAFGTQDQTLLTPAGVEKAG